MSERQGPKDIAEKLHSIVHAGRQRPCCFLETEFERIVEEAWRETAREAWEAARDRCAEIAVLRISGKWIETGISERIRGLKPPEGMG